MLLVNKIFRSLFLSAVKFCNLIPPFSFGFRLLQFIFTLSFDDQLSLFGRCVKCVAIIYDHIVKIKQEVGAELYGEDANITGEARLEGRERIRYTRGQLLQLKGDILKLKQEVEAELFGEHPNQDHADADSEASCFGSRDRVSYTRDQLLQLREVVNISDHILKIKQDVESELFGEDASRGHAETDSHTRCSEEDTNRNGEYNGDEQLSSQFARTHLSPNQGIGGSRVEGCKSFRYTLDQMLQLREVANISEDVLRIKEVAPLLFREDVNVPAQSQARCFQLQFPTTQQQYTLWDLDQGEAFIPTLIKPKRKRARRRNRSDKYHVLKTAKEVDDILIIKQEVESELFVEGRGRADANVQVQPQTRCSETDSQQNREYNGDEQLSSQFATTLISPNQGGGSAEMPCSAAQKSNFSDKDHVLKTVRGILNQPTANKFDPLKSQLIASEITNADTLFGVVSLIFNKAVLEPTFCPMYAQLFSDLCEKLPRFPSDEPGGGKITVKRILLNRCQEAFEGADKPRNEVRRMMAREQESEHKDIEKFIKLRNLGNIKLIGELFKLRMVAESIVRFIVQELLSCPEEENVEAICQFFITTGKQLDENENSRCINDVYFNRLKELSTSPQLVPRLRFMVLDVLDLRSNNWIPRREEVGGSCVEGRESFRYTLDQMLQLREEAFIPTLIKPKRQRARRGNRSGKNHVLKTAKGILNKLTPENFDLLKGQLLDVGITRADILKGVISLIFDKAALEPTFCPMYAQLCSYLNEKLPPFPSTDEPDGEEITFEHVLLNTCDEAYEVLEKLREEFMQMTAPEQESERKDKKKLILSRALGNKMLMEEFIVQDLF
ncbi:putative protein isoform X1 [Capsicum galapagoense]